MKQNNKLGIGIIIALLIVIALFFLYYIRSTFSITSLGVGALVAVVSYLYISINFKVKKELRLLVIAFSIILGFLGFIISSFILSNIWWIALGLLIVIILLATVGYFFGVEILAGAILIKKLLG